MLSIGHDIGIHDLEFPPLPPPHLIPLISLPHQLDPVPPDQEYAARDVVLPDVFNSWRLPLLAEGGLVDLALDLMVVLEVSSAQRHAVQEMVLRHRVGRGYFLGDGLEVHWPVGKGRGVAVDVVGYLSFRVDSDSPQ